MDIVTAYLYGSLDLDIYMKVHDGISIPNMHANHNMYCVKLVKSLYGLKQSKRRWYNRLKEFLLNKGYSNNDDCPCVFIRKYTTEFYIISNMLMTYTLLVIQKILMKHIIILIRSSR
jgi:hypothetical protein